MSRSNTGERNSQHGTAWICKPGEKPRKVPKAEVPEWERKGWHRGRKQTPKKPRERQWISKPGENPRQVPLEKLDRFLSEGWVLGRSREGAVKS